MLRKEGCQESTTLQRLHTFAPLILVLLSIVMTSCLATPATELSVDTSQLITPSEYKSIFGETPGHFLIDVRTPEEFASGYIEGAVNISVESLPDRLNEVPKNLPVVVYCRSGRRSAIAADLLVKAGYQSIYDLGGIQTWIAEGYPVEN